MASTDPEITIRELRETDLHECYALLMAAFLPDEPTNKVYLNPSKRVKCERPRHLIDLFKLLDDFDDDGQLDSIAPLERSSPTARRRRNHFDFQSWFVSKIFATNQFSSRFPMSAGSWKVDEGVHDIRWAVGLTVRDAHLFFLGFVEQGIKDKISFVAVNSKTGSVVGCRLNESCSRQDLANAHDFAADELAERTLKVASFLDIVTGDLNAHLPDDVDKFIKLVALAVHKDYRRLGIAKRLMDATLALAREQNYKAIVTTATTFRTQNLFGKMGFEVLNFGSYADYVSASGERVFANMDPEEKGCQLLMLKL